MCVVVLCVASALRSFAYASYKKVACLMHDKKPSARLWRWLGGVGGGRQIRISGMGGFGVLHRFISLSLSLSPPTHHHQKTKLIGKFALSFRNMEKGGGGKRALGSPANEHSPII